MAKKEIENIGKTTISPSVLVSIAKLTTLGIDGVSHLSAYQSPVSRLLNKSQRDGGIRIEIEEDVVNLDIHVILNKGINIRRVSREIQNENERAISEMVGMHVGQINIHIEDVD